MRFVWNAGAGAGAGAAVAITTILSLAALVGAPSPRLSGPVTAGTVSALSASLRDTLDNRFERANTSRDGRLTFEQARAANWVSVAREFGTIDSAHAGFVTSDQVRAFFQAHPRHGRSDDV